MDSVHDMGGMDGFGKVNAEPNEPVFHERWEGRVLAMSRAISALRLWTIDMSRYGIELLSPSAYLASSYYERWFLRNVRLLTERGLIEADEIAAGHPLCPDGVHGYSKVTLGDVWRVVQCGSAGRPAAAPARFKIGDRVRAKNIHPLTHPGVPRYALGHVRVGEGLHGAHVLP